MSDPRSAPAGGPPGRCPAGSDWVIIAGPISEGFALRIAGLCFLGPAAPRRRPRPGHSAAAGDRATDRRRHPGHPAARDGEDAPPRGRSGDMSVREGVLATNHTNRTWRRSLGCPLTRVAVLIASPDPKTPHWTPTGPHPPLVRFSDSPDHRGMSALLRQGSPQGRPPTVHLVRVDLQAHGVQDTCLLGFV